MKVLVFFNRVLLASLKKLYVKKEVFKYKIVHIRIIFLVNTTENNKTVNLTLFVFKILNQI